MSQIIDFQTGEEHAEDGCRPINQQLISILTNLLEAAQRGDILSIAGVFTTYNRKTCHFMTKTQHEPMSAIGEIQLLSHSLTKAAIDHIEIGEFDQDSEYEPS